MHKSRLTLVTPGLSAGTPLARFLARADREDAPATELEPLLFALFDGLSGGPPPVAAVAAAGEGLNATAGWWLRADPVQMTPSRNELVLIGNRGMDLSAAEAEALAAELRELFAEQGAVLYMPHPQRWYLRLERPQAFVTVSLAAAEGRNVGANLPSGADAWRWQTVLNEAQMRLHQSAINRARERRGDPVVNSLWFWGGGVLPTLPPSRWAYVCGDDPLVAGLARVSRARHERGACGAPAQLPAGEVLRVSQGIECIEPYYAALKTGQIGQLTLYRLDGYVYRARRAHLWRFWRRDKTPTQR